MSSRKQQGDVLIANAGFRDRYQLLLAEHLPPAMKAFAPFFANVNRLETMSSLLARHVVRKIESKTIRILNAGSGAFAAELFSAPFQNQDITSFDYTEAFAGLYPVFRGEGLLRTTTFSRADANTVVYPAGKFDLIVFHDIFYETALDIPAMLGRFQVFLRPGGYLYLDFMSQGTGWLWRVLGRGKAYKRYAMTGVQGALFANDFEILELKPSGGVSNPIVGVLNRILWAAFRTSNAYAIIARKKVAA